MRSKLVREIFDKLWFKLMSKMQKGERFVCTLCSKNDHAYNAYLINYNQEVCQDCYRGYLRR